MTLATTGTNRRVERGPGESDARATGIAGLLRAARARLDRLHPESAHLARRRGGLLVDIRPAAQRAATGEIPGALFIERNVLEWRLDPACDARLPVADRYDLPIVLICQEGYASSLAAAGLQDLGLRGATDVIGGFAAWLTAGLPALAPRTGRPASLPAAVSTSGGRAADRL